MTVLHNLIAETERIFDDVYSVLPSLGSEDAVAEYVLHVIRSRGFQPSFNPFIASGEHSTHIHPDFESGPIQQGFLLVDIGIFADGYNTDLTRMFYCGCPSEEERRHFALVESLMGYAMSSVHDNCVFSEVDTVVASMVTEGKYVMGRLGHGIGRELHQSPSVRGIDRIMEGQVFTLEPALYFSNYGIRIENMLALQNHVPELLSRSTLSLRNVP